MLDKLRHIYFLGIGGIGMSALARYFISRGVRISGYDKTPTELTDQLIAEGMSIHFDDDVAVVPGDIDLVVLTPAIPADHKEWKHLREKGIPIKKRAEVLGMISRDSVCLAVAGTHGKTTTTTMLAHLLRSSGVNCTAFLGGIAANYRTNYLQGDNKIVVVEADEYDRSFLQLSPSGAILTAIDADHLDIYGDHDAVKNSYLEFTGKVKNGGHLVIKDGIDFSLNEETVKTVNVTRYGIENGAATSGNVHVSNGAFVFNYKNTKKSIDDLHLSMPGRHNVENATAAITLALEFGATTEGIKTGIQNFLGVHRRFEFAVRTEKLVVIDDYAHHPEELKAAISAAREMYPGKRIAGVFQPHLFSRTRDFADQFARSLELLDDVVLLDIYPAREKPMPGVTSAMLLEKINRDSKRLSTKSDLVATISSMNFDVLLMMGAGDIDQLVKPVADALTEKGGWND
ncbi:MAG TPA: UDP-N-acetylmuramate--L-alanine ligase [Bacteroidia bacterium]|nr:UDP-N-acetylmuramate--L-alanine ligase [Bacteroidia bacterium]